MYGFGNEQDPVVRDIYSRTDILRKPITGIVSGYHELPYVLVAPEEGNQGSSVEVNGTVSVSPRFVISPQALNEKFGEVFDPETFDKDISGRLFSFAVTRQKNLKVESRSFQVQTVKGSPRDHANRVQDDLLRKEDVRTGLIFAPVFKYYPVSIDRFISEIVDREFSL